MSIGGLALGSAFLDAASSIVITPVAKEGKAIRLLIIREGFAALLISAGIFLLPLEAGLGTITRFGLNVVLLFSGPSFGLGTLIYYRGIRALGLSRAYPLVNIFPLFSTLLAILLLGERPTGLVLVGTVIILTGVWLIAPTGEQSRPRLGSSADHATYRWMAVMVGASVLFAISTMANKVALNTGLSPLLVNLGRTVSAGTLTMVAALTSGRGLGMGTLPRKSWARIAIASLVSDLLARYMYFLAMQLGQVSAVVPLANTSPLFIVPMAHFVLKERITWLLALGMLLAMLGVILVVAS
jgi:DME family drug/metabolite transporter